MRRFVMLALLVVLGVMTWRLGSALSSDALGMAVGVVFGVLAGVPAALLVLATGSRRRMQEEAEEERYARHAQYGQRQLPAYPYQPPVIVVAGGQAPQAGPPMMPQAMPPLPGGGPYYVPGQVNSWEPPRNGERRFKVVGESEEWL